MRHGRAWTRSFPGAVPLLALALPAPAAATVCVLRATRAQAWPDNAQAAARRWRLQTREI